MGEVKHQTNSEGVVDIYEYTTDLILETCPTMEASSVVSTAERLIHRATNIFERRETARLQNGQNFIENEVIVNEKMEGKLLLENDTLDTSLYGKKKNIEIVWIQSWKKIQYHRIEKLYLNLAGKVSICFAQRPRKNLWQ
ncbi:hypothetical protein JTB14_022763 [Gonioctena quinquepunctata]|nr:hypothetical protein JTB14_022763 [Gonioctena quinquepunctata]